MKREWILAVALLAAHAASAEDIVFPADAGVVDVKAKYGARGDGLTDIIPRKTDGPERITFALDAIYDDSHLHGTMWLVNPAFVVPNWNQPQVGISMELDGATLRHGSDYRFGFEPTATGKNLVIWLNKTLDLTAIEDHRVEVAIKPNSAK